MKEAFAQYRQRHCLYVFPFTHCSRLCQLKRHDFFQPRHLRQILLILICGLFFTILNGPAAADPQRDSGSEAPSSVEGARIAERIEVQAASSDQEIDRRLTGILEATGWFPDIAVQVEEGVVLLDGYSESAEHRAWAGELAGKTSDVVAVVNRLQIEKPSPWDFSPAFDELLSLWEKFQQRLPRLGLALLFFLLVLVAGKFFSLGVRKLLDLRFKPLLRDMVVRILSIALLLIGCYLVLQVAGLSGLAATVLGGTGIAGLVAGIAFRDILENYLASLLISIRNPFRLGDLVEITGHTGVVLHVTTRGTVLMNQDGNHVQIPNATVYKSIIRNYSANPNRRDCFEVGIGFDNELSFAQQVALDVLNDHPAVLNDPEPLVLVDRLGAATVNLLIYFWYDGSTYNGFKLKSSVIRLVKKAFEREGISMPDEAREVIFPEGVPIRRVERAGGTAAAETLKKSLPETINESVTNEAEGDLTSEDLQLREQGSASRVPEEGASILEEKNNNSKH